MTTHLTTVTNAGIAVNVSLLGQVFAAHTPQFVDGVYVCGCGEHTGSFEEYHGHLHEKTAGAGVHPSLSRWNYAQVAGSAHGVADQPAP